MSSRPSRRSAANANQLNRCTIPLWDKKKLVKELQERGLDTAGTQPDLAERLISFLDGIITAPEPKKTPAKKPPVATPKTPKSAKNTPKSAPKKKAPLPPSKKKVVKQEEPDEEQEEEEDPDAAAAPEEAEESAPEPPPAPVAPVANGKVTVKQEPVEEEPEQEEAGSSTPAAPQRRSMRGKQTKERENSSAAPTVKKKESAAPPAKKAVPIKVEVQEEEEEAPSTSGPPPPAAVVVPEPNGAVVPDEKRSRRKSARLLASEQMDVDEEPTTEDDEFVPESEQNATAEVPMEQETAPAAVENSQKKVVIKQEPIEEESQASSESSSESQVSVKSSKKNDREKEKRKSVRVKEEIIDSDDNGKVQKAASSCSSDPDFEPVRHSKRTKDHSESSEGHHNNHQDRRTEKAEKLKKVRHSTSSAPSAPVPTKPKQASWQEEWAKKLAEQKQKNEPKMAAPTPKPVEKEVKRKESGEKSEAPKKRKNDGVSLDAITALMSSSIPKKEKVEKRPSIDHTRVSGGSDATSVSSDYHHRVHNHQQHTKPQSSYPSISFFNPPAHKGMPQQPSQAHVPPAVVGMPLTLPPPPPPPPPPPVAAGQPPVRRRKSRFDQPPADFQSNFYPKANAPPPSLTTTIQISRRSPIPPPPPPRRNDDIPPPPPPQRPVQTATTDLQRRVQEIFSGGASSEPAVPLVFAPAPTHRALSPPPPPPPKLNHVEKRPLIKEEPIESQDDDDDDDFVIRDTVVEDISEPVAKMIKLEPKDIPIPAAPQHPRRAIEEEDEEYHPSESLAPVNGTFAAEDGSESAPKAINKLEEQKRKDAIAEERKRRAAELGDGEEGEYDPMASASVEESCLVYDYQPTNALEEHDEEMDEEMDEGEDEEEEEEGGDEEEEEGDENENEDECQVVGEGEQPTEEEPTEEIEDNGPIEIKHSAIELLQLALPVLQNFSTSQQQPKDQYAQIENDVPTESLLKRQDDEKPEEVYYHGEPVPEVDENELYEIAAGIKPKKKEKKALVQIPDEERLPADAETIELDYYNADILVKSAEKNIWQIEPFNQDGLALMWGGIRSNFGIQLPFRKTDKDQATKIAFQIQIEAYQSIQHLPTEFMSDGGDVRIGFSLASSPLVLGEYPGSWCITATGKRAANNHFYDFGHSFGIGDVVTCIFDLEKTAISYLINGAHVGTPYQSIPFRDGELIFPTICTKNANINVNLGQDLCDEKWMIAEDRDWMFITEMDRSHLVRSRVAPEAKKDCTVLMTVGLPGVGKTTWVRRYLAEHPHENWTLISADVVMDAMKVNGVPRIRLPTLKRPDFLRGIIGKSMARLIMLAPRRRKNYILDMTNCMADKRKRKLMAFEEFNRKCMIFVPDEDTHQKRLIKQEHEENEKLDTDAIMQHKAAMSLPSIEAGDPCEEVIFIDPPAPNEQIAYDRVSKMTYECRSWLVVPGRRGRGGGFHSHGHGGGGHHRGGGYHNDHHGGGYQQQQNQFNRPSTSGPSSSGANQISSPRLSMNITHTTFQSNNTAPAVPSPLIRAEDPQSSSAMPTAPVASSGPSSLVLSSSGPSASATASSSNLTSGAGAASAPASAFPPIVPVQVKEPIILPPVKITGNVPPVQPSPAIPQLKPALPKLLTSDVSKPLTLNLNMPRKSFDVGAPSSIVSSGRSSFDSPRFGYPPKEHLMTPTSVGPPLLPAPQQPSPVLITPMGMEIGMGPVGMGPMGSMAPQQMGQQQMQHMQQIPMFPIDVTVPPPNFSTPPPMIPGGMQGGMGGVPPHLLMFHQQQMSGPPPPPPPQGAPFSYPPPQYAPR